MIKERRAEPHFVSWRLYFLAMLRKPPREIGSAASPTGQVFTLWTYEQLDQLPKPNLKTRA